MEMVVRGRGDWYKLAAGWGWRWRWLCGGEETGISWLLGGDGDGDGCAGERRLV